MNITIEEKKQKALELMKKLDIYKPYIKGFEKDNEAVIVRRMFEEYASGRLIKDILDDLNNEGVLCHGKPFVRSVFYKLLKNEKYIGIVRFGDQVYDKIYPPIVSEQVFDICRAKAQANKIGKHTDATYLLKNKVHCGY